MTASSCLGATTPTTGTDLSENAALASAMSGIYGGNKIEFTAKNFTPYT